LTENWKCSIFISVKFEIYLLHREEVFVKYLDVTSVINFLSRSYAASKSYSIVARRGERAIFIEKITNLNELSKKLMEFMTNTTQQ